MLSDVFSNLYRIVIILSIFIFKLNVTCNFILLFKEKLFCVPIFPVFVFIFVFGVLLFICYMTKKKLRLNNNVSKWQWKRSGICKLNVKQEQVINVFTENDWDMGNLLIFLIGKMCMYFVSMFTGRTLLSAN